MILNATLCMISLHHLTNSLSYYFCLKAYFLNLQNYSFIVFRAFIFKAFNITYMLSSSLH